MAFPRRSVLIPTIVVRSHATVLALAWASLCSDPPPPKGLCNSVGRQGLLFWFASWLEPCSGGPLCTWFGAEPGRLRALCGLAFVRVGSPINHRPVSRFLSWWWPSVAGPLRCSSATRGGCSAAFFDEPSAMCRYVLKAVQPKAQKTRQKRVAAVMRCCGRALRRTCTSGRPTARPVAWRCRRSAARWRS